MILAITTGGFFTRYNSNNLGLGSCFQCAVEDSSAEKAKESFCVSFGEYLAFELYLSSFTNCSDTLSLKYLFLFLSFTC
jgi:hypothetical protein